jgi:hypothetical protein
MPEPKNRELTLLVTVGIAVVLAALEYLTPIAMRRIHPGDNAVWIPASLIGVCIAQVTLVAAWAVFAPGNIVVRWPWALLLGLMSWYVLVFGQYESDRYYDPANTIMLGLTLLVGVTVLQVPLWITKRVFRVHLLAPGDDPELVGRRPLQFELKHLLIGTLIFAVALSPIRVLLPKQQTVGSFLPDRELLVILVAVIVVDLVATLPCFWGGFASSPGVWRLAIGWAAYILVVTLMETAIFCNFLRGGRWSEVFFVMFPVNVSQGAVVFAVMRIYRTLGFRLERIPRHALPLEPDHVAWEPNNPLPEPEEAAE